MTIEQKNSLTEQELGLLIEIINRSEPKILPYEFDENLIMFVKHPALCQRLQIQDDILTDEGKTIFSCLKTKLGITS